MVNYFELMNVPQHYQIDIAKLQQTLRQLQSKFHPDNNLDASVAEQNLSLSANADSSLRESIAKLSSLKPEQASAIINEAYNKLKNPDSRASHLLALKGISQSINQPIRDLDFLDDAMSFRIDLDDADSQSITLLSKKLTEWLSNYQLAFDEVYQKIDNPAANGINDDALTTQAIDIIQKLQFLVKLQADVAKTTDELAQQNFDNDDDLYV
ncbi:MAG TPA: Fe-S protein assembly co-chaperone HscB [Moraxellaceae bacterium]|nr:Fe-S protein assembly co-chaperone HscB [Moraxella sp.]HBI48881.1 Fe-S protein assembly co-chaperone HscB [Moraxellaceae bacterium]